MFSKFKRNKMKTGSPDRTSASADPLSNKLPVVGMPALKQKRMSERNEELQRRIRGSVNLCLNDFERTGIAASQNQMKFIGKPDVPCDHETVKASAPEPQIEVETISTSNIKKKEKSLSRRSSFQTDPRLNRGRDLHSVKSQRKASREKDVNESVIALTPRERESILCLDNVLKEHDMFDTSEDDDVVFRDEETGMELNNYAQVLDESSDSDSSMDSVIDLVGDLSTGGNPAREIEPAYVSYRIPTPANLNAPDSSFYETIPFKTSHKKLDRVEITNNSRIEIGEERVSEEVRHAVDQPSHHPPEYVAPEPVYSIVDKTKKTSKPSQKSDLEKSEPIYSVVDKSKKTPKPKQQVDVVKSKSFCSVASNMEEPHAKREEPGHSRASDSSGRDVKDGTTEETSCIDDNPTAVSSRQYWIKMHEARTIAQARQTKKTSLPDLPLPTPNQRTIFPKREELKEKEPRENQNLFNRRTPLPDPPLAPPTPKRIVPYQKESGVEHRRESQNSPRIITENGVTRNASNPKPRVMPKPKRASRSTSSSSSVASPTRQFVITPAYTKTLSFD